MVGTGTDALCGFFPDEVPCLADTLQEVFLFLVRQPILFLEPSIVEADKFCYSLQILSYHLSAVPSFFVKFVSTHVVILPCSSEGKSSMLSHKLIINLSILTACVSSSKPTERIV